MANEVSIVIRAKNFATKTLGKVANGIKKLNRVTRGMGRIGARGFRMLQRSALAAGAAIGGIVMHASTFRQQMALVNTMLPKGSTNMRAFTKDVIRLSAELGLAKDTLAKGLYQVLSAGVPEGNALEFLATAARAAVGGATDVEVAVDGLTTVMNAYGLAASEAAHVSDLMFTVVKDGKTTYEQLAENIAKVAPIAKVAGVTIEDLSATIAALVKVEKPERAMTALTAAMVEAARRGQTLFEMLNEFEGASFEDIIGAGITKRAAAGVALLAGNMGVLRNEMKRFENVAGAATEAFDKTDSVRHWQKLLQSALATITEFGLKLDEFLGPKVDAISKKITALRDEAEALAMALIDSGGREKVIAGAAKIIRLSFEIGAKTAANILGVGIKRAFRNAMDAIAEQSPKLAANLGIVKAPRVELSTKLDIRKGVFDLDPITAELDKAKNDLVDTINKFKKPQPPAGLDNEDNPPKTPSLTKEITKEEIARRKAVAEVTKLEKERVEIIEKGRAIRKQEAREAPIIAQLKKLNKELDAANQKLADAKERVAKLKGQQGFQNLIAEQREKANAEEFEKKRQDRIRRIREKIARGIGLGKGDREFVKLNNEMVKERAKAAAKLAAAKKEKDRKEAAIARAQVALKKVQDAQLTKLTDIDNKLVFLRKNLMAPEV